MSKKKKIILLAALLILLLSGVLVALFLGKGPVSELLKKLASSDTFNQAKYIKPDYDVDGVLDEEIWEDAPCITFGNPETETDEVTFRFYYGKRGITASFVVTDQYICNSDVAMSTSQVMSSSDSVYMYLDVKNDGTRKPQIDDLELCFAADGRMGIAKGSGDGWNMTTDSVEYQVVVDGTLNELADGDKDVSWTTELFIPYEKYGIDKEAVMGLMLQWGDSNVPAAEIKSYYWGNNGPVSAYRPEEYHPINKDGVAFAAPEGWVPSMGRYVSDDKNDLVAEDVKAVAYYTGAKMQNGAGTVEATIDISNVDDYFANSHFSGLLFGVEEVGETERPGWEIKSYYGAFLNNDAKNPAIVLASVDMVEGNPVWTQIAAGSILEILPDFLELKECTVKVRKNGGWMEVYLKDAKGTYQQMFEAYDAEAINGDYIGVRTPHLGFALRDVVVTTDAPAAVQPYEAEGFHAYMGLVQKLDGNSFLARTAGTTATFGKLVNKYNAKTNTLKSFTTSLTFPELPKETAHKTGLSIKGLIMNYNPDERSYLIMDYNYLAEKKGCFELYLRARLKDGWGGVSYVMDAEANTKYDFRITPIENADGTIDVFVEYKKASESEWKYTYCKNADWKFSGEEYGVQTSVGNMKFDAFKVIESDYARLDAKRYDVLGGAFLGRSGGGVHVLSNFSTAIDKEINPEKKDSYAFETSFKVVPDQENSIKGIIFNHDEKSGSYMVLDYRYYDGAYPMFVRYFNGTKWADVLVTNVDLKANAWYDFRISVINGKSTTSIFIEYKTGDEEYTCVGRTYNFATNGRQVGYTSTGANGIQFGNSVNINTTYIGAEDSQYKVTQGAFFRTDTGVQAASTFNVLLDKTIDLSGKDKYVLETSFKVVPDKDNSIKGITLNYDETTGEHLVLDYRYHDGAYRVYVRHFTGKSWGGVWTCGIELDANYWYKFRITVENEIGSTTVGIEYCKSGIESYASNPRVGEVFGELKGRQVGFQCTSANGIQFGKIVVISSSKNSGASAWPDEWSDALKKKLK